MLNYNNFLINQLVNEYIFECSKVNEGVFDNFKENMENILLKISDQDAAYQFLKKIFKGFTTNLISLKFVKYALIFLIPIIGTVELTKLYNEFNSNKVVTEILQKAKKVQFVDAQKLVASDSIKEFIKGYEKLKLKPYKIGDHRVTVGYGHTFKAGETVRTISEAEADKYFDDDVNEAERYVKIILKRWTDAGTHVKITQDMFDVLVSVCYNGGYGRLKSTEFIKHLKQKHYNKAGQILKNTLVSAKFPGLKIRRAEEADKFLSYENEI